jgi:hypothetical protein
MYSQIVFVVLIGRVKNKIKNSKMGKIGVINIMILSTRYNYDLIPKQYLMITGEGYYIRKWEMGNGK